MSVARVGLDAISTSLPTSHVCCEQVNQNLARSCQIQVEVSEKNVDCENEMELLGFQGTPKLVPQRMAPYDPSHLQALALSDTCKTAASILRNMWKQG